MRIPKPQPREAMRAMVEDALDNGVVCVMKEGRLFIGCNPDSDEALDVLHELRKRIPKDRRRMKEALAQCSTLPASH